MMDEFEVCVTDLKHFLCWQRGALFFFFLLIQSNLTVFPQVNIQVPAPDQQSDKIAVTGLANHLDRAKEGLLERVKELQAEQEDRVSIVWRAWMRFILIFLNQFIQNESVLMGVTSGELFMNVFWSVDDSHTLAEQSF